MGGLRVPAAINRVYPSNWQNKIAVTNFSEEEITLQKGCLVIIGEEVDNDSVYGQDDTTICWPQETSFADDEHDVGDYLQISMTTYEDKREELPEHLQKLYEDSAANVSSVFDKALIHSLLSEYQQVFSAPGEALPGTTEVEHHIHTGDHAPRRQKVRHHGPVREAVTETELKNLQDLNSFKEIVWL